MEASDDKLGGCGWDRRSAKGWVGAGARVSAGLALMVDEPDPIGPLVRGYVGGGGGGGGRVGSAVGGRERGRECECVAGMGRWGGEDAVRACGVR